MIHRIPYIILSLTASALLLWQTYDLVKEDKKILMRDIVSGLPSSFLSMASSREQVQDSFMSNKTYGYFLQITDIHIDDHYTEGATLKSGCHKLPKEQLESKSRLCSVMGEPGKRMDAPPILIEHTLDWIRREWKDKLDFVIWTGDNSRHDWDAHHPRKKRKVLELNQKVADKMAELFNYSIPVVPVIGNNDVQPHNYIKKKDDILGSFETMWDKWIPADQRQDFLKGGYFAVDVVPNRLRVLAMNTMFFMKKNPSAQTCSRKHSVGYLHMRWYERQLLEARQKGLKVYVIGHVPPSTRDFFRGCMRDYLSITSEYSDVVMGHFYGHLNMDHFLLYDKRQQEEEDYLMDFDSDNGDIDVPYTEDSATLDGDVVSIQRSSRDYVKWLKKMYKKVVLYEKEHNRDDTQYDGARNSMIGKIFTADTQHQKILSHATTRNKLSKNANEPITAIHVAPSVFPVYMPSLRIYRYEIEHSGNQSGEHFGHLIGYSQFVANITRYNNDVKKNRKNILKPLEFELEYDTKDDYGLEDLSPHSYLNLARIFYRENSVNSKKGLWGIFCRNMFLQTISNIC